MRDERVLGALRLDAVAEVRIVSAVLREQIKPKHRKGKME
jgi:hypothetical protein